MSNPMWRQVMGGGFLDYAGRRGHKLRLYDGQVFVPYGEDFVVYVVLPDGKSLHVGLAPEICDWLRAPVDHSFLYAIGMFDKALAAINDSFARLSSAPAPP